MPQRLTLAFAQVHTLDTLSNTLDALRITALAAASKDVSILLFPEAYLGGYPRRCNFGAAIGARSDTGREQFLQYFKSGVDLGDTPQGGGDEWIERRQPVNKESGRRGDGTREFLEDVARDTGVFIITGVVERAGGSLYCSALYVDPKRGVIGKRRKVMPTGTERLVWAQGQPSTLKAVSAVVKGVKVVMGTVICWENYMPLLRYSMYSQGVNLWLAPTADARDTWEPLIRTIAFEGRCFVVSANQCVKVKHLPDWITTGSEDSALKSSTASEAAPVVTNGTTSPTPPRTQYSRRRSMSTRTEENHEITWRCKDGDKISPETAVAIPLPPTAIPEEQEQQKDENEGEEFASRGGSCIVSPLGKTLVSPVWEQDNALVCTEVDFDDCERGRFDFDATGHYSRSDAFTLTVQGLDLSPPA